MRSPWLALKSSTTSRKAPLPVSLWALKLKMSAPASPLRLSLPSPPIRVSLPRPPNRLSLPPPPLSVLLAALPVRRLARPLPVPLMAALPASVRFSRLAPRLQETYDSTLSSSVARVLVSMAWSAALSTT
ncbi:hypothetical protein D3C72_1864440 [compost metagenome]